MSESGEFVFVVFVDYFAEEQFKTQRIVRVVLNEETARTLAKALGLDTKIKGVLWQRKAWGQRSGAYVAICPRGKMEVLESLAEEMKHEYEEEKAGKRWRGASIFEKLRILLGRSR